uniref:Uncharacterized protein n=1 Tax=Amphimedon queenslandica TaxID=400682 RepID=A0A1X7TZX7_AMPQE
MRLLHKLYKNNPSYQPDCQISSGADNSISTITRSGTEWIGIAKLSNGAVVFGAALNCIGYCRYKSGYTKLIVNDTSSVAIANSDNLSNSVPLCIDNREGLLCSQCPPGYSVVFGSYECKQCSNWWLFTLIIYAVIGPLLIYLFYILKLTLTTGTLNGIIFCAQLFSFIDLPSVDKKGADILLNGWNQYQFDYSLCLYNGMTELWKQGLRTMYQVYILSILLGIIVLISALIYGSSWYFIQSNHEDGLITIIAVSNAVIITSLLGVIILHILWVTGLLEKIKIKSRKCWFHCLTRQNQEEAAHVDMSGSFFEPYDKVREPLLSY